MHGLYDGSLAVVLPPQKNLIKLEGGAGSVRISSEATKFGTHLEEALSFSIAEKVYSNQKLRLAIELYSASLFENSQRVRLIHLITSLEALLAKTTIGQDAATTLNTALSFVDSALEDVQGILKLDLERLKNRMNELHQESIGGRLRQLVQDEINKNSELGVYDEVKRLLMQAYNVRSKLVHDGLASENDIDRSYSFLNDFVPRLLEHLFRVQASICQTDQTGAYR